MAGKLSLLALIIAALCCLTILARLVQMWVADPCVHGPVLTCISSGYPCQAVSSAHKALSSALAGVVLQADEEEQLAGRLKGAADKKLSDLLQVGLQHHTVPALYDMYDSWG